MKSYIGLIRGINLGRAKRVAMADLRAGLTKRGLRDVATLLNSGNVLFRHSEGAAKTAALISHVLDSNLGVKAEVVVRSVDQFRQIIYWRRIRWSVSPRIPPASSSQSTATHPIGGDLRR